MRTVEHYAQVFKGLHHLYRSLFIGNVEVRGPSTATKHHGLGFIDVDTHAICIRICGQTPSAAAIPD